MAKKKTKVSKVVSTKTTNKKKNTIAKVASKKITAENSKKIVKKVINKAVKEELKNSTKVISNSNAPLAVEMTNITKKFGNIYANKDVSLNIRKGEIHALLGENGAGKSTIMSILFGLYEPDSGIIKVNGEQVQIKDPNDATKLKIGMVHQHFKLVDVFSVLDNIIMGRETYKCHFLEDAKKRKDKNVTRLYVIAGLLRVFNRFDELMQVIKNSPNPNSLKVDLYNKFNLTQSQIEALLAIPLEDLTIQNIEGLKKEIIKLRDSVMNKESKPDSFFKKIRWKIIFGVAKTLDWFMKKTHVIDRNTAAFEITAISKKYGLNVDLYSKIEDITVGMQQRTEIIKMLYRNADILIFDEPTAVLTPDEIDGLLQIMRNLKAEGKTIIFITHKLNEIMAVADRVTVLRRGEVIGTKNIKNTNVEELSDLMVGRHVDLKMKKKNITDRKTLLKVRNYSMFDNLKKKNSVTNVSFDVNSGEIVAIAGIDGNGQRELVYGITGLERSVEGTVTLGSKLLKNGNVKQRNNLKMSHIPEDRHRHGLVLDYKLDENLVLRDYRNKEFDKFGFIDSKSIRKHSDRLISEHDIRSSLGSSSFARSMSGGNQQKAIVAREIDRKPKLLIAVQPTRGVDVGAIENIHKRIIAERDRGVGVLLVSYELDEVFSLADRILVMYEGEIVGEFNPNKVTRQELGLYMSGAKKNYEFKGK